MAFAEIEPLPAPRHDFKTAASLVAIAKDAQGRLWLGGGFLEVDGLPRSYIVRLLADGSVDSSFTCELDGAVQAIVFDNSNRVYLGGFFQTVNGQPKSFLARASLDCVLDTSFPVSPGPSSVVYALALNPSGDAIFVGGSMSQPSSRVVRYSTVTGLVAPGFGFTMSGSVLTLASDGAEGVYAGGAFPSVNGQTAYARLAHLQYDVGTATSSIDTNFAAAANGNVFTLLVTNDSVFAGGAFSTIAGNSRSRLVRLLRSNGSIVSAFQPEPNDAVRALAAFGSTDILVAGGFDSISGRPTGSVARVSLANGVASLLTAASDSPIRSMYVDGTVAHVGGGFSLLAGEPRAGYGALDFASGVSVVGQADAVLLTKGGSYAHWRDPDGSLWVGGSFLKVDGQNFAGLVRLTPTGQIDTSVNPDVRGRHAVYNMTRDNQGRLYFGGELERIGTQARAGIGRLLADNTVDTSFSFKLRPRAGQLDATVFKLVTEGNFLYVLGDFDSVEAPSGLITARSSVAKINLQTNTVVSTWDPDVDFVANAILALQAIALDSASRRLYIGGSLTAVDGTPRNRLAAIHLDTGELISGFNPGIAGASAEVWELALDQAADRLYVGGSGIASVEGNTNAGAFFRLAASTGTLDQTWMSGIDSNQSVEAIALDDQNHVYVGGTLFTPPGFNAGGDLFRLNRDALAPRMDPDFLPEARSPYELSFRPSDRTLTFTGAEIRSPTTIWNGLAVLPAQGYLFRNGFEGP